MIDFYTIVNLIYIGVSVLTLLLSLFLLTLAFVERRRCLDFPTVLACNTILTAAVFSANVLAISIYMYLWDEQLAPDFYSLYSLRGYIPHSSIACIHHSLVLQAIQKYCTITRVEWLNSTTRQVCLVLGQWIFDFTFGLPMFLTGNITKLAVENVCLVSFSRPELLFTAGGIIFLLSDTVMITLYGSLIRFVRKASTKVSGSQQQNMNRDMAMVRRIVMLHFALLFIVLPAFVAMILGAIRIEILPYRFFRILCFTMAASAFLMLIVLFWITPKLRKLIFDRVQQVNRLSNTKITRVIPIEENQRV